MGKSTKAIALTAGLAGVAGLAALVSAPSQVSASTTGTVTYQQGATTVWKTPAFNQVKRYVLFNQRIAIQGSKVVNGAIWYQIGANEWIPAVYLQAEDGQTANANAAADQATSSNSASDTQVGQYKLTVTYVGGATTVWASTHYQTPTGRYLATGQQVTAVAKTTSNGETWYRLSTGGYVPARFASESGSVVAPAASAAPASSAAAPAASAAAPAASFSTPAASSAAPAVSAAQPAASSAAPAVSSAAPAASSAAPAVTSAAPVSSAAKPAVTAGTFTLTVNYPSVVTVWSAPSFTTASGKYLSNGQKVTANGKVNADGATWYQLTSGGYIPSNVATTGTVAAPSTTQAASAATTTATKPAATTTVKATAPAKAATTSKPATTTSTLSRAQKAQKLIATARLQIGKPYQWGAKGPNSFDCSGLVYYTFKNALGITLGGYTGSQQYNGTRLSVSQLQPGDLVFWATAGVPYHVALYIGNNQYIHAPQPGQTVQVGTISGYFAPSFGVHVAF
ncbi:cell surface protein [Lacticaseibacillus camelliae DSM 22697 = JCM 13995]|uniref:Cell surface protein n=1 Tax=Lacticaseibacillus camelliae DSM 22697 = JCM 13995 TaxID=1423730 RepID=A0A0R2FB39_9LACO|nr:C40 family peptidase [Lacticaseibacillus camelliae]KRN21988.1 cell surface protein [Lacticaseibacillus camelliae DSM 22697 = JCM 13995]